MRKQNAESGGLRMNLRFSRKAINIVQSVRMLQHARYPATIVKLTRVAMRIVPNLSHRFCRGLHAECTVSRGYTLIPPAARE